MASASLKNAQDEGQPYGMVCNNDLVPAAAGCSQLLVAAQRCESAPLAERVFSWVFCREGKIAPPIF